MSTAYELENGLRLSWRIEYKAEGGLETRSMKERHHCDSSTKQFESNSLLGVVEEKHIEYADGMDIR